MKSYRNSMWLRKAMILFLCFALMATTIVGCSKKDINDAFGKDYSSVDNQKDDNKQEMQANTSPWIVEQLAEKRSSNNDSIYATAFYEGLAGICIEDEVYFIDEDGNLKISLGSEAYLFKNKTRFCNGLCYIYTSDKGNVYINKEGKIITPEDLGGTAFFNGNNGVVYINNEELLAAGYIVVNRITSSFDGALFETAIFNTDLEQIQPYSAQLYTLFHDEFEQASINNGYLYYYAGEKDGTAIYKTYHIDTNVFAEYTSENFPYENKMDETYYNAQENGMVRDGKLVLDLSQYPTLRDVIYKGKKGLAIFYNEANEEFFTVLDENGNMLFEPIRGTIRTTLGEVFDGTIIVAYEYLGRDNGVNKGEIITYNTNGEKLGSIEVLFGANVIDTKEIDLGDNSIMLKNRNYHDRSKYIDIFFFNEKLELMFPVD